MKAKAITKSGSAGSELEASFPQPVDAPTHQAPSALQLKKILVPVDFSDLSLAALDYALALADRFQAGLILLHVVEPTTPAGSYGAVSPALEELHQSQLQSGHERLIALSRKRVNGPIPVQVLVRIGRAYSEIPDTANALGADLIVMGTAGQAAAQQAFLGGTAERVIRQAPCPVLTLRSPKLSPSNNA